MVYNEIRRADVFQKFGYYCPETFSVPKCMELGSMHDAVDLGFKNEVDKNSKWRTMKGGRCILRQNLKIGVSFVRYKIKALF